MSITVTACIALNLPASLPGTEWDDPQKHGLTKEKTVRVTPAVKGHPLTLCRPVVSDSLWRIRGVNFVWYEIRMKQY